MSLIRTYCGFDSHCRYIFPFECSSSSISNRISPFSVFSTEYIALFDLHSISVLIILLFRSLYFLLLNSIFLPIYYILGKVNWMGVQRSVLTSWPVKGGGRDLNLPLESKPDGVLDLFRKQNVL